MDYYGLRAGPRQLGRLRQLSPHRACRSARPTGMRRFAWIWLAGCIVWLFNAGLSLHSHATQRAELNLLVAVMFGLAYAFYASQKR